jgi:HlyD family secretion protein
MSYSNGNGNQTSQTPQANNAENSQLAIVTNPDQKKGQLATTSQDYAISEFEQPVVLRQSPFWSRAIIWGIAGVTVFALGWAWFAKIDEAVPAQGKLEPQGAVKEVQAPVSGVVEEVHVEDGETVEQGELLMTFDQTAPEAELESLGTIRAALEQENEFYRSQLNGSTAIPTFADLNIPPDLRQLTTNRVALFTENQLYRNILEGRTSDSNLSLEQQDRLRAGISNIESRTAERRLEIEQLSQQLAQVRLQLENAQDILSVNQRILGDIQPLYEEGGVARIQFLQQQQEVNTARTNVNRLVEEEKRLELAIQQAREQLQNTIASSREEILSQIEANQQRIAEIDSQIGRVMRQNEQRIAEIDSQLRQAELTLNYQELRAPVGGTVFDLQVGEDSVVNNSETVLTLVPGEGLVAEVFITNRDIGFVEEGMPVDVRIDSFPYSEFGDIKGEVISIGSDALPPDEVYNYYRFPAEIKLDRQQLNIRGKDITLQSGMSVSVNIKVRDRRVIDIFTGLFRDKVDSLQQVR